VPEHASAPEAPADHAAEQLALARTYLDMSMPDEALAPLRAACEAIRFRFEAASLLGRLHQQRGETLEAIEWLERAAEAPAPSEDEGHALLYDLGTLVEASGDTSRALAVFLELQSDAGTYRDVAERVERLARVETGG
jgi:tetratricopeptide (TPR) repeat protein